MCNIIRCSIVVTLIVQTACSTDIKNSKLLYSEQEIVDALVKAWSPLVWLAPNEKFLPGDVKTFLTHVHAEREKQGSKKIKDIGDNLGKYSHYYQNDGFEDILYYEGTEATSMGTATQNNRKRRNFDKDTSLEYIFELPIDDASENWFLVTNDELENLMKNKSSFIYGENPSVVPIYAVVSMCGGDSNSTVKNEIEPPNKFHYKKNPYIPLTKNPEIYNYGSKVTNFKKATEEIRFETNEVDSGKEDELSGFKNIRQRRSRDVAAHKVNETQQANRLNLTHPSNDQWKAIASPNVVIYTKSDQVVLPSVPVIKLDDIRIIHDKTSASGNIPHFHVTYWMFYPFSQGKTVCTLNFGPLGPIPIPLIPIFNICLGTKKEFGSHVGDWEHMSLFFRGGMEPEEMYVSAHDAGAFYTFDRLTGTFEFKSQESRKGIFQKPNFPKTVITSENHPVLFSAEGSHGLWATPGKHRFVRVPRLYDVNGFGQPWQTWKNVKIIYNDIRGKRSMGGSNPNWMKYRGKWGNPKTKCHPLRKIGLHVCEQTDGPTGIPKKTAHFTCSR